MGGWTDWVMMFGGPRVAGSDRLGGVWRQRGRSRSTIAQRSDRLAVDCGDESALRHAAPPRQWRAGAQARLRRRLSARGARSRPRARRLRCRQRSSWGEGGACRRLPHRLPRRATARAARPRARAQGRRGGVRGCLRAQQQALGRAPRADIGPMARAGRLALEQFVARVGDVDDDLHAGPCRIWNTLPHWMVSAPRSALTMNDSLTPTLPAASSSAVAVLSARRGSRRRCRMPVRSCIAWLGPATVAGAAG